VAERYDEAAGDFDIARDLRGEVEVEEGEVYRDDKGIALRTLVEEEDGIAGFFLRTFAAW
jgi:hypothetical protein